MRREGSGLCRRSLRSSDPHALPSLGEVLPAALISTLPIPPWPFVLTAFDLRAPCAGAIYVRREELGRLHSAISVSSAGAPNSIGQHGLREARSGLLCGLHLTCEQVRESRDRRRRQDVAYRKG